MSTTPAQESAVDGAKLTDEQFDSAWKLLCACGHPEAAKALAAAHQDAPATHVDVAKVTDAAIRWNEAAVDEYLDGYSTEFDNGGSYSPTEAEQFRMKDAIMGLPQSALATPVDGAKVGETEAAAPGEAYRQVGFMVTCEGEPGIPPRFLGMHDRSVPFHSPVSTPIYVRSNAPVAPAPAGGRVESIQWPPEQYPNRGWTDADIIANDAWVQCLAACKEAVAKAGIEQDPARLDWLEKNPSRVVYRYGSEREGLAPAWEWASGREGGRVDTLRAAIDAARQAEGKESGG